MHIPKMSTHAPAHDQPKQGRTKHVFNLRREKLTQLPKRKLRLGSGTLPKQVDLSQNAPSVYNQGQLGSCTSNSLMAVMRYHDPDKNFSPSRLFHYYCERQADGDVSEDGGSTISQSISVLRKVGVCSENTWPYVESKFAQQPPHKAYVEAAYHKALQAVAVSTDATTIKTYLSQGFPINIGIVVYPELESDQAAQTGIVGMPQDGEDDIGGHAIWIIGYDDNKTWDNSGSKGMWKLRNSWGEDWGLAGNFFLPYAYLRDQNLASDFWNLQKVEDLHLNNNNLKATWHDHEDKEVPQHEVDKIYSEHQDKQAQVKVAKSQLAKE